MGLQELDNSGTKQQSGVAVVILKLNERLEESLETQALNSCQLILRTNYSSYSYIFCYFDLKSFLLYNGLFFPPFKLLHQVVLSLKSPSLFDMQFTVPFGDTESIL